MDIEKDGFDEVKRRQKLIDMWAEKNGDEATYDQMVTAMIKAEKINEATKVCKLLTPQSGQFSRKWIRQIIYYIPCYCTCATVAY